MTFNPDMSTFHYPDGQTKLELELAPPELGASLIAPVFLGSPLAQLVNNHLQCRRYLGLIPRLGRSPGEGKGYALQYSGLENSRDCIVHGVAKSRTQLTDFHSHFPPESELALPDGRQSLSWNHTPAGSIHSLYPSFLCLPL